MFEDGFEAFVKLAARQQDTTAALLAYQPNVRTDAHHVPIITAAGMLLAQTHLVADVNFDIHSAGL